jgi:hypothetical protein
MAIVMLKVSYEFASAIRIRASKEYMSHADTRASMQLGQKYSAPNDPNCFFHPSGNIPPLIFTVLVQDQQVNIRVMLHLSLWEFSLVTVIYS